MTIDEKALSEAAQAIADERVRQFGSAAGISPRDVEVEYARAAITAYESAKQKEADGSSVEIRRNDDGSIDEVVARGVSIHLEQLDMNSWYLGLDAPGEVWQFWLTGKRRTMVDLHYMHSTYTPRAMLSAAGDGNG